MKKKVVIAGDYLGYKLRIGRYNGAKLIGKRGFVDLNKNTVDSIDIVPIISGDLKEKTIEYTDKNYQLVQKKHFNFDDPLYEDSIVPRTSVDFIVEKRKWFSCKKRALYRAKIYFRNGKHSEIDLLKRQAEAMFFFVGVIK